MSGKYIDNKGVIRYPKTDNKKVFQQQLEDFEKQAKKGKTICLTDLLINAETQHLKNAGAKK